VVDSIGDVVAKVFLELWTCRIHCNIRYSPPRRKVVGWWWVTFPGCE